MQIDRTTQKHYKQIEKEYIDKFRVLPKLPITGSPEDYYKMLEEALLRNTPVTEEDYDKYFPIEPGIVY